MSLQLPHLKGRSTLSPNKGCTNWMLVLVEQIWHSCGFCCYWTFWLLWCYVIGVTTCHLQTGPAIFSTNIIILWMAVRVFVVWILWPTVMSTTCQWLYNLDNHYGNNNLLLFLYILHVRWLLAANLLEHGRSKDYLRSNYNLPLLLTSEVKFKLHLIVTHAQLPSRLFFQHHDSSFNIVILLSTSWFLRITDIGNNSISKWHII